ncbi:hypothetical protein [Cryptosporidium hominis TU502]|uniref:hypothetical protein n=1 Tax=Cryptosporidium hominis (strain TU502) TaxID=353151 RepID=UPI0000452835|nr:hypothetical protein [Cryptosporidium hominis TU502]
MVDKLKINIYSANKQNIKEVSTKCVEFLKSVSFLPQQILETNLTDLQFKGENRTVVLIAKSSAIPKAISISEIIKMEVPNVSQLNSLVNLEVSLIFSK